MVHLKLRIIDIKFKLIKYVIFIAIFLLSACDFRLPQKWETPSWELPLSIPLYNGSITMFELIDTSGSDLTLDTLDNYSLDTSLVMISEPCPESDEDNFDPSDICCVESLPGYNPFDESCPVRVTISDEYFTIEDGVSIDLPIDPVEILIDTQEIDPISETKNIVISELLNEDVTAGCLPLSAFDSLSNQIILDTLLITPYDQFTSLDIQYLDSINNIIIDEGFISVSLENNLPLVIDSFQLNFLDQDGLVWADNNISNLLPSSNDSDQENLAGKSVPREINVAPLINYSASQSNCYLYLSLIEIEDEINFSNQECINLELLGVVDSECALDIDNESECSVLNDEIEDYDLVWNENECKVDAGEGININGNETLIFSYTFQIDEGKVDVKINLDEQITGNESLPIDFDGIDFISGFLKDIDDSDDSKNRFELEFKNDLFSEIDLNIAFDNLFDENLQPVTIIIDNPPNPNTQLAKPQLDNYFIGNPDSETPLTNIGYTVNYSLTKESVLINMNQMYKFEVFSAELKPLEFDELIVDFQEFETDSLDMGDIPAGFGGFELPTLGFDLIFNNTINASLKLELDITGSSDDIGDQPVVIQVEPIIEYKGNDIDTLDITVLSILDKELVVTQSDGSTSSYPYGLDEEGKEISIYDVFSKDNISIIGDAKLTGRSKLEPGRSVWADMEVMIDPLSIIITDNISFISEAPITLEPIDASTSSKIDSGIVSATVDLEIENAIPLNGTVDMIISNSQFFPPCLDSLTQGSMTDQIISNACAEYLYSNHSPSNGQTSGPGQITVQSKGDYNFYYIEFINPSSNDTTFFGKFLNMSLILPDEINNDGIVISPSNHTEILDLLSDEVKWLTNDNTLYIAPQVVLLSHDDNDIEDNGWRTIKSSSYLNINSLLTLVIDMGEVIESKTIKSKTVR